MPHAGWPPGSAEPRWTDLRSSADGAGQRDATVPLDHACADLGSEFFTGRRHGDVLVLSGEIDLSNAAAVSDWIADHVATGVGGLDLSGVTYCGAAGVRALLTGRDALPPGGTTLTMTCSPLVLRVLRICAVAGAPRVAVVETKSAEFPPEER